MSGRYFTTQSDRIIKSYNGQPCIVDGCSRFIKAKYLCALHYNRMYRRGEIGGADPIQQIKQHVEKICSYCKVLLPLENFPRIRKNNERRRPRCQKCETLLHKTYKKKYAEQHTNEIKKYRSVYYITNKSFILKKNKVYYTENFEKVSYRKKIYQFNNFEALSLKKKEYRNKNRIKARRWSVEQKNRRRARQEGVKCDFTYNQWKLIIESYNHCCAYCHKEVGSLTQDHIIPLSKGGEHTASNIVPACRSCNCRKQSGPPLIPLDELMSFHPFYQAVQV